MTNGLKAKLLKLREISGDERCPQGERANAEALYKRLMSKYGLQEIDLQPQEEKAIVWFPYKDAFERWLIGQIVAKVVEPERVNGYYQSRSKRKTRGFELSENQAQQVTTKYRVLSKALTDELEHCYSAFVQVNKLGLKPTSENKVDTEDIEEIDKLVGYMRAMKQTPIPITDRKRLIEKCATNQKRT